ncbi:hypothetical protein MJ390_19385 [Klebsiella pneumoniae]|nr:hypothetical protein MJ390_19385 [Klebsiella pneumoniae]
MLCRLAYPTSAINAIRHGVAAFSTEVYPIGIDPDEITRNAKGPLPPKLAQLKNELKNVKNIFSVGAS